MSEPVYVAVICEGPTERMFVEEILAPHFQTLGIYMTPTILTKKGENGGDVKYSRLYHDLQTHLRQGHNRCVTTLLDFYGLKDHWPGYEEAKRETAPSAKQTMLSDAVKETANRTLEEWRSFERFLPHFVMHEIEALYFSCPETLADKLGVEPGVVQAIVTECGEPEAINHERDTSPSHRLDGLASGHFRKTSTGIAIAKEIGLSKMREVCPLFNQWVTTIEGLA
ncbi:DUF4276 family protein [Haloferula sp. A504]|uniref:DUF4276 family protein n=1 Tax=Haloferula sp. A504 TaxID=3373601 RepID=UPI0031CA6CFA|nr:DUF4276 family protein [Verrucomicrobiaceae bacterium E54]